MILPKAYQWLQKETAPLMLLEALRHYGTLEHKDSKNNPSILAWAKEVGGNVADVYKADSIAWCGLFMAIVAKRAGYVIPKDPLWALNWGTFGTHVEKCDAMLGDVLVFVRNGGGHVAEYVGEDATTFHIVGGNQSDAVTITRISKNRLYAVRRPVFKIGKPSSVRKIYLNVGGSISTNEA